MIATDNQPFTIVSDMVMSGSYTGGYISELSLLNMMDY